LVGSGLPAIFLRVIIPESRVGDIALTNGRFSETYHRVVGSGPRQQAFSDNPQTFRVAKKLAIDGKSGFGGEASQRAAHGVASFGPTT
jgi:hypothetical protein